MTRLMLVIWLLVTAAATGASAWIAIHRLTGGVWGQPTAAWRRMAWLLPISAMLAAALLLWAPAVLPWMHHAVPDERTWYLSRAGITLRTVGCFFALVTAAALAQRLPALSLILWLLACGGLASDWIVALSPDWRSSIIGFQMAVAGLATAFAAALLMQPADDPRVRRDHAGMLIALCLGWAYLAGCDYLTAWVGDQPFETGWYLPRLGNGWVTLILLATVAHLLVPLVLLLTRGARGRSWPLRMAAASALAGQACHLAWMVLP